LGMNIMQTMRLDPKIYARHRCQFCEEAALFVAHADKGIIFMCEDHCNQLFNSISEHIDHDNAVKRARSFVGLIERKIAELQAKMAVANQKSGDPQRTTLIFGYGKAISELSGLLFGRDYWFKLSRIETLNPNKPLVDSLPETVWDSPVGSPEPAKAKPKPSVKPKATKRKKPNPKA
jgi:hypothetical protein